MIAGLLAFQLIANNACRTVQTKVVDLVVVTSSAQVVDTAKLFRAIIDKDEAEKALKKLGFYYRDFGHVGVLWDNGVFDLDASNARVELWQEIAQGKIKPRDTVLLGDTVDAFSNSAARLCRDWGVTPENCQNLKMQFNIYRKVTVENETGQRMTRVLLAGNPNGSTGPTNDLLEKPDKNADVLEGTGAASKFAVEFFGFSEYPQRRLDAPGGFFDWIATKQAQELSLIDQAIKQFESIFESEHPEWVKGSTVLNEQELMALQQEMSGYVQLDPSWAKFRVASTEPIAAFHLKFLIKKNGNLTMYGGPVLEPDRPKEPKPIIKP